MTAQEAIEMPFQKLLEQINKRIDNSEKLIQSYHNKTFIPLSDEDVK